MGKQSFGKIALSIAAISTLAACNPWRIPVGASSPAGSNGSSSTSSNVPTYVVGGSNPATSYTQPSGGLSNVGVANGPNGTIVQAPIQSTSNTVTLSKSGNDLVLKPNGSDISTFGVSARPGDKAVLKVYYSMASQDIPGEWNGSTYTFRGAFANGNQGGNIVFDTMFNGTLYQLNWLDLMNGHALGGLDTNDPKKPGAKMIKLD